MCTIWYGGVDHLTLLGRVRSNVSPRRSRHDDSKLPRTDGECCAAAAHMRNLVRPALSTLFGGELTLLAPSHSTVYDAGGVYGAGGGVGGSLSMMSWNLLAPCYKRPAESSPVADARILAQTAAVRASQADIVNLQEFWLEPSHVGTWWSMAAEEGYCMLVSPRSGGKRDGCCMLVRRSLLCAGQG